MRRCAACGTVNHPPYTYVSTSEIICISCGRELEYFSARPELGKTIGEGCYRILPHKEND